MQITVRPIPTLAAALLAGAALGLASPATQADLLVNGNFETSPVAQGLAGGSYCYLAPIGPACGASFDTAFGWSGSAPVIAANSSAWGTPGSLAGFAAIGGGSQLVGIQTSTELSQYLALGAGNYTLQWADAGRIGYAAAHYQVLFGDTLLGSYDTQPGETWALNTLDFTVTGAGTLTFRNSVRQFSPGNDGTAFIDGLVLSVRNTPAQVPEPHSLGLVSVAMGALGLAALAHHKRRRGQR